jgi:hypothetical protein
VGNPPDTYPARAVFDDCHPFGDLASYRYQLMFALNAIPDQLGLIANGDATTRPMRDLNGFGGGHCRPPGLHRRLQWLRNAAGEQRFEFRQACIAQRRSRGVGDAHLSIVARPGENSVKRS